MYFNDVFVGAVCCRLDKDGDKTKLYIMTLGVLAPYRKLGIGKKLFGFVADLAAQHHASSIYLHVQTTNDVALSFYEKLGFKTISTDETYYKGVDDTAAHLLQKDLQ